MKKAINLLLLGMVTLTLSSCSYFMKWQKDTPDNAVEEWVEDKIKESTGKDVDLTPVTGKEKQWTV